MRTPPVSYFRLGHILLARSNSRISDERIWGTATRPCPFVRSYEQVLPYARSNSWPNKNGQGRDGDEGSGFESASGLHGHFAS